MEDAIEKVINFSVQASENGPAAGGFAAYKRLFALGPFGLLLRLCFLFTMRHFESSAF